MFERLKSFLAHSADIALGQIGFADINHGYKWTRHEALANYERSLYASKAIDVRAKKISQIDYYILDNRGEQVENEWSELLRRPNSYQTGDQFMYLAQKYYDIVGASYILKVKGDVPFEDASIPDELHILRADQVEVLHDAAQTKILGFRYTKDGKQMTYNRDQVIYHYRPDPRNPLLGESLLSTSLRAIETESQISEYHNRLIRNGGRSGMIINFKSGKTQDQLDEITEKFQHKYAGAENAGRPFLLSGEAEVHNPSMTPTEMDFIETKNRVLSDILIATGVPKPLLGIGSGETYANADAEIATFLRDKIKPELENWSQTFNWQLIPDNLELHFADPTPEDIDRKIKILTALHTSGAVTTNEKREMFDYEETDGGDEILIPFNLRPLNEPDVPTPQPTETRSIENKSNHPLAVKAVRKLYAKQVDRRMTAYEKQMYQATVKYFEEQQERVIKKLGRKRKMHKDLLGDMFDVRLEASLAQSALLPTLKEIFLNSATATADTFGFSYTADSNFTEALTNRMETLTESIVSTTSDQLAKRIADTVESGGGRNELVESIQELYTDITLGRANTIARTETHFAMQNGNLEAYRQAGFETKIWVTVGDAAVRDEHADLDGTEVKLDSIFPNGEMFPGEKSINCRCSI